MPIIEEHSVATNFPRRNTFETLKDAYHFVREINRTHAILASNVYMDFFKGDRPKSQYVKFIGVERKAERICKQLAPGQWRLELSLSQNYPRFQAWYSRFLPYAVAMMECESGFKCLGIDQQTIYVIYRSVTGFNDLGFGDGYYKESNGQEYHRIVAEDVHLFSEIYAASMEAKPPHLIFDEVFRPCTVYASLFVPQRVTKIFPKGHYIYQHIREVCEAIGKPVPKFRWR